MTRDDYKVVLHDLVLKRAALDSAIDGLVKALDCRAITDPTDDPTEPNAAKEGK